MVTVIFSQGHDVNGIMDGREKSGQRNWRFERVVRRIEPWIMIPLDGIWAVQHGKAKESDGSRDMMIRIMKGGSADVVYVFKMHKTQGVCNINCIPVEMAYIVKM